MLRRCPIVVFFALVFSATAVWPDNPEPNPARVRTEPSAAVRRLKLLQPAAPAIAHTLSDVFIVAPQYEFENTLQVIAPQTPDCEGGAAVLSAGDGDRVAFVRAPLYTPRGKVDSAAQPTQVAFPAKPQQEPRTDNILLKLKDGSLLALRQGITWEDIANKPAWWDQVTYPKGYALGSRVGAFVWRSTDCGKTWTAATTVDPINFENGRYAVPRPAGSEKWCDLGCFGGWDRIEAYADPFDGNVYLSTSATGGPLGNSPRQATNLLFRSKNNGKDWEEVFNFPDAWTPTVISSTPNGRVYLYSVTDKGPTLYYSLLGASQLTFSKPVLVFYTQNGLQIPPDGNASFGKLVAKYTNSISRVSTDASSSKVRLSYPFIDLQLATALAVIEVSVPDDAGKPFVRSLATIRTGSRASILASAFIDPDAAGSQSNISVLYWMEGSTATNVPSVVRYSLFRGDSAPTAPVKLADSGQPTKSTGHYMYGGAFTSADGGLNYVAQWAQADGIRALIITVPAPPPAASAASGN